MSLENNQAPTWLNSEFVKNVLQAFEGHDRFNLKNFSIGSGTEAGQNFAGVIIRLNAVYSVDDNNNDKSVSFILKSSPSASVIAEILEELNTFEAEKQMYAIHRKVENVLIGFKIAPK
jgi:Ecdysteroid kinase-like family